jgi:serine/threonine-protein kinase
VVTAGTTIGGRFRVDHLLGAGGMGIVVAATHLELGHRVAIKLLRDEVAASPTAVERFLREARSVVQLRTEHVCRVIDVGRLDTGAPYIVMELLDGSDLGRVVAKQPLPVATAVEYVLQACVALAEAHAAGIVHRDLKPANLFVTRRADGGPLIKVLDFGIAKALSETGAQLTHSHSVLGSPGYISPEQLYSARDVDVRTDIWALGVTLYQLLSARLPFYRENATEMAVRIATEDPDPLEVVAPLGAAVLRCLAKQPADRYPDVAALATDLVPFGGPSARSIAASVHQVAGARALPSVPLPVVDRSAITAASIAQDPAAGPADRGPTDRDPVAPVRRRRWLVAPVLVLGIAGAAVLGGQRSDVPGGVAMVPGAAMLPGDAASEPPVTPPDAVAIDDAAVRDAGPRRVAPAQAPHPAAPPATRPRRTARAAFPRTVAEAMAQNAQRRNQACLQMSRPEMTDPVPPVMVVFCACELKDAARARTAFARLMTLRERGIVRDHCTKQGIKLP